MRALLYFLTFLKIIQSGYAFEETDLNPIRTYVQPEYENQAEKIDIWGEAEFLPYNESGESRDKRDAEEVEGSGDDGPPETTIVPNTPTPTAKITTESIIINDSQSTEGANTEKEVPDPPQILGEFFPKESADKINGKSIVSTGEEENTLKTDASTKSASNKDTTILVGLFIAVCVVGAGAFAYNYAKKRKQHSDDLAAVENGTSVKRSLQNLTQGPESKPLIHKTVEMVDMKRDNGAEAGGSREPTIEKT